MSNRKDIGKQDVFSSASLTGVITYTLLYFQDKGEYGELITFLLSDTMISFWASASALLLTFSLSFLWYFMNLKRDEIHLNSQLSILDSCQERTDDPIVIAKIKKERNLLLNRKILEAKKLKI